MNQVWGLMVPNKTIYVSDADLSIFEEAQELAGGNLSAAIAQALRHFVSSQGSPDRLHEVEVKVGKVAYSLKQFKGRLIAKGTEQGHKKPPLFYEVYQTAKGQFAVHTHMTPGWSGYPGVDGSWLEPGEGEYHLEVYENLSTLEGNIPDELYNVVVQNLEGKPVEELDI